MEAVSIGAVVLAAITMVSNVADKLIKRRESKDRMDQDVKVALLEQAHKRCEETTDEIKRELTACRASHEESERDRRQLRDEINQIKSELLDKAKADADDKADRAADKAERVADKAERAARADKPGAGRK